MAHAKITEEALAELRAKIGKPPSRKTPPFYTEINTDAARHFAYAIGDDNPLYCDLEYGRSTIWGAQLAPPCILYSADNVVSGAIEGLPSVHAMYAGTDFHFHEPIRVGTRLSTKSYLKDLIEIPTRFAGRSIKQVYAVEFCDQRGTRLADAESWVFRTERDAARERTEKYDQDEKGKIHHYSDDEIREVFEQYRKEAPRGARKLRWSDVAENEDLPPILKGPYTITAAVGFMQAWGGWAIRNNRMAFKYYDLHPRLAAPNQYNVPEPPVRVHWDNEFAQAVGAPGAYDFGPERVAWLAHLLSDWIGDAGMIRRLNVQIRHHNVIGDLLWCRGKVAGKRIENGRHLIDLIVWADTAAGKLSLKGEATVELPE
ncbi:MAG: MaoC family dehydratase N-terminal domain-containing protein [Sphingobium sp.]